MRYILTFIFVILTSTSALAQQRVAICSDKDTMNKIVTEKFGEDKIWEGIDSFGLLIEIYINIEEDSWSAVRTEPGGKSCLISVGNGPKIYELKLGEPM